MGFDGVFAGVIARKLNEELAGAKIEKIRQPESDEILMQVNGKSGRKTLLLCTNPGGARVQFTDLSYENPPEPPAFCMLLRKHIQGGRIKNVSQPKTERVIIFEIETVNELGYSVNKRLIAETMGKHSNLILIDSKSEKIIDSIKRVFPDVNRYRQILPGFKYVAPPTQEKIDFWTVKEDENIDASKIQGLSKGLAAEIENAGDAVKIRENLLSGKLFPAVYLGSDGNPKDVHIVKLENEALLYNFLTFKSPEEALDYFYSHKPGSNKILQKCAELDKTIETLINRQLLKKQRLSEELKEAYEADEYRIKGELITANIDKIAPGAEEAHVINYYNGEETVIGLDKRFSAAKNAQNFFKKYSKLKNSVKEKTAQLKGTEDEISYLKSMQGLIPGVSTHEEIDLIRAELAKEGHIKGKNNSERRRGAGKPRPRRFKTTMGLDVLVGRSGAENDAVTFKLGGKTDIWLHAKDIPGSHAVLLTKGKEAAPQDIYEAASIAAYFSKGNASDKVPVDYVPLRKVKKPSGAKPGMVIFTGNRTVWVKPELPSKPSEPVNNF